MTYFSVPMKTEENLRRICVSCLEHNRTGWLAIALEVNVIYALGPCKLTGLAFRKMGMFMLFFSLKKYVTMPDWHKMMHHWLYEVISWPFPDGQIFYLWFKAPKVHIITFSIQFECSDHKFWKREYFFYYAEKFRLPLSYMLPWVLGIL